MNKAIHDRRVFEAGKVIIRQGDIATAAYIIQSGKVQVFRQGDKEETGIALLGPGEIFGEMALIEGRSHNSGVRAVEQTVVFVVTPETLEKKIGKADPLVRMLLAALVERLGKADSSLRD